MSPLSDERGFALPLTILVITVMTMLIASANVRARADRIIAESSGSTVNAFAVAQSGLQRYFAYYDSLKVRPVDGDSLRINVPSGFADVLAHKVRIPSDTMETELYIVRSTGYLIEPLRGSDPQAQRTVAQFADWQSAAMTVTGAFTAANGMSVDTAGRLYVEGIDHCASPGPSVTGVRTTGASPVSAVDFYSLTGSPPLHLSGGGADVANSTLVDWPAIVGGQFDAEYYSFRGWDASRPTMLIDGDLTVTNGFGYGLLIVTGDLTLNGVVFSWRGAVLVGGRVITNALLTSVRGVLVTGLNEQLGISPPMSQIGGSILGQYYYYDSCEVRNALDALVGFVPVDNAWMDNWAMY